MEELKRLDRKLIRKCHVFDLYEDTIGLPDGRKASWDLLKHVGAAAVIPVRADGKLLLVKQFRNSVSRVTLEIPAGKRDSETEDTYDTAVRELEEETGYRAEKIELLLNTVTAIAYCDEIVDVYVATGLKKTAQHLDEDEFIDVVALSTEELKEMIFSGKIRDAKTIASVMAYIVKYGDNFPGDRK